MLLREYAYILYRLVDTDLSEEDLGVLAAAFKTLISDWSEHHYLEPPGIAYLHQDWDNFKMPDKDEEK